MPSEPFDEILGLEESFYAGGFKDGLSDGIVAGRVEGRKFGLEKGFEKYTESAQLYGKSLIWAARITHKSPSNPKHTTGQAPDAPSISAQQLPAISKNPRLVKHLRVLHALAESESLSTENTEQAVSDFDDRYKRALAKAKILERMVGEMHRDVDDSDKVLPRGDSNIEDASIGKRID